MNSIFIYAILYILAAVEAASGLQRSQSLPPTGSGSRKDIMSKPLPQTGSRKLERVNSAPGRNPDPKALDLMKAEDNAKAARSRVKDIESVHKPDIRRKLGELNGMNADPTIGATTKYAHAVSIIGHSGNIAKSHADLAYAYKGASQAASVAGRDDRRLRNAKKSITTMAKASAVLAGNRVVDSRARANYLPTMASEIMASGGSSELAHRASAQGAKTRAELPGHERIAANEKMYYQSLRRTGGKDSDSE